MEVRQIRPHSVSNRTYDQLPIFDSRFFLYIKMRPDRLNCCMPMIALVHGTNPHRRTANMPKFDLSDEELDAIVAYLEFVDETGTYPPKEYRVRWFGTVEQEDDPR